ncbi:MAG: antibiotic biosynthesis monooxygenase [Bauldia sp.]
MFVTIQKFEIEPDSLGMFRAAITKQAEVMRQRENGCRRVDVNFDPKIAERCLVYTVFIDEGAYNHHILSDHYNVFDEVSLPWIVKRTLEFWDLVASPTRAG